MSGNAVLNKAKYSSNTDEWYTTYETVCEELSHYTNQFKGKTVLCNCDDPFKSNFTFYFLQNFNKLGLRKLISTSYANSKIDSIRNHDRLSQLIFKNDIFYPESSNSGFSLVVTSMPGTPEKAATDEEIAQELSKNGRIKKLEGNGDFRSEECVRFLKECDICCTNPPFSLFVDLFLLINKYKKQYLLIGNQNALTYKDVFPYIMKDEAWVGYRFGHMAFRVPADTPARKTRFWIDENGQKWRSIGNAMWLTNLDIPKRHRKLELKKRYSPQYYPKYDNYDAINVARVADIPIDYYGVMGVPITFLKYYNDSQFEIVGEANHGSDNEFDLFKPIIDGKQLYKRLLIRRRTN